MKKKSAIVMLMLATVLVVWAQSSVETPVRASQSMDAEKLRVVKITARRFEFVPNKITLKKGEPVVLQLTSEDVTHGFFVRPLKIDEDVPAGQTKQIALTPEIAGKFTTICDHFCGVNHGAMHMTIEVVE